MYGIDLNAPIAVRSASYRFFKEGECYVERVCPVDVLLLVYEGVLRFYEDGVEYEVSAGQYHIQKADTYQIGVNPSDMPKYLWVHFFGQWSDCRSVVPKRGYFDHGELRALMDALAQASHNNAPYIERAGLFYTLLSKLPSYKGTRTVAQEISAYISNNLLTGITLEDLGRQFYLSKNQVINVFKKEYGQTPAAYIINKKLMMAEYLLEVTWDKLEDIAYACGFHHYSHFYRSFIKKNGMSPYEWRQEKRRIQ